MKSTGKLLDQAARLTERLTSAHYHEAIRRSDSSDRYLKLNRLVNQAIRRERRRFIAKQNVL